MAPRRQLGNTTNRQSVVTKTRGRAAMKALSRTPLSCLASGRAGHLASDHGRSEPGSAAVDATPSGSAAGRISVDGLTRRRPDASPRHRHGAGPSLELGGRIRQAARLADATVVGDFDLGRALVPLSRRRGSFMAPL